MRIRVHYDATTIDTENLGSICRGLGVLPVRRLSRTSRGQNLGAHGRMETNMCVTGRKEPGVHRHVLRAGEVLQGTIEADGETQPAQDVAFAEGVLSFGVDGKFAGLAYRLKYSGKPQGDTLSGRVWSYSWASGTFPFRGERIGEQLASTP